MISEDWTGRLWQRFKDFYGQKWVSLFQGSESIESWRITWATLDASAEQIKIALSGCVRWYPEWPPTYGQFQALCNEARPQTAPLALSEPKPEPPSPERRAELLESAARLAKRDKSKKYWRPEVIVNSAQVNFCVMQARYFGDRSRAAEFLRECNAAGVITADNQLANKA